MNGKVKRGERQRPLSSRLRRDTFPKGEGRGKRGRKCLRVAAVIFGAAVLLAACDAAVLEARQAKIDREVALDLSLKNIELVEIYFNPSLKGSVAVDRQTGVMYWVCQDGHATPLIDAEGRPRLWK